MIKRKLKFNAIDALLIVLAAAALFVLLYVFVFDNDDGNSGDTVSKTIQYTVLIQNLDESSSDVIKVGQPVTDAIKKKEIGTVVGVEVNQMIQPSFDYDSEKEVYSPIEGRINVKITIEALAEENEKEFKVDDCIIRVGTQYSIMFPNIYCVGYCIDINDNLQK